MEFEEIQVIQRASIQPIFSPCVISPLFLSFSQLHLLLSDKPVLHNMKLMISHYGRNLSPGIDPAQGGSVFTS